MDDSSPMRMNARPLVGALALVCALGSSLLASPAAAGGYDTPMLYSARHMGMGGAAVGYVDDASSLFHNPAGLGQIGRAHLLVDISLLVGDLQASPTATTQSISSETTVAPAFLIGGAYRVHDWVTVGLGFFPVAAAGGEYRYPDADGTTTDSTTLNFFELTPAVAVNIDDIGLRIGASYRITFVSLDRSRVTGIGSEEERINTRINASGTSFAGFRLGLQYQPPQHPNFQIGLNYRHKTTTTIDSSGDVFASTLEFEQAGTDFILPARIALGARYDFGDLNENGHALGALAVDFIYAFNSQNDSASFTATGGEFIPSVTVDQVFDWFNEKTLRIGGEVRLLDRRLPLRLGYTWDGKTGNARFPTAFGTPAAATHIFTLGGGYDAGPWELNFAFARRMGSATITQQQLDNGRQERMDQGRRVCSLCGGPGDYEITLNGIYIDFSYDWD